MSNIPPSPESLHHHATRMHGRDPHEVHRAATPLELLFDLTFVIAFGLAASQFAHFAADGHIVEGLIGFGFACFAICWAWINFSWFASAYDTDDWIFRVVTMVQMLGVLILALGLPRMFSSIEHGHHLDTSIMVVGYVVMRVAMVFQWLRAARQDPARRRACLTYATSIVIAQLGWLTMIFFDLSILGSLIFVIILTGVELTGPMLAERKDGGTPWHPHHIAERYSLLAIIALGEGVVGTVATVSAVVDGQGWTMDAALLCIAGTGLTFGLWWVYYIVPAARMLHAHRNRSFVWGYGHIIIFAAIVAIGAGLHVAAYYIEHKAHIGSVATVLTVAVPVAVYILAIYAIYTYMVGRSDPFHLWLLAGTLLVILLSIGAALSGLSMALCLIILTLAPVVTIVGYELLGHRHQAEALAGDVEKATVH
jgi:low temperature requirement protein LtrA